MRTSQSLPGGLPLLPRYKRFAYISALGALLLAFVSWRAMAQRVPEVPPVYRTLYATMSRELDMFENTVRSLPDARQPHPLIFGADLSYANNNAGPLLFTPRMQDLVKLEADRFKEMGVGGVHVTLGWPQMSAAYDPDYEKYVAFYTSVAAELRARHILFFLHNDIVFPKPFSRYDHPIPHIGFAEYKRDKRQMVQNLINTIHPDYLIVASEPKSDANNSGISELDESASSRELINYVINGDGQAVGPLQKGTTLVGAGADTWESTGFVEGYASIPNLDFITIHVYPFGPKIQSALLSIVDIGHRHNKRMFIDEAWLYKSDKPREPQPEVYKRDMFSFFEPLDQRFLGLMAQFCRKEGIEFLSGFWTRNFFAYNDYHPGDENRSFPDARRDLDEAARQALMNNTLSPLGEYYKSLATSARHSSLAPAVAPFYAWSPSKP